TAGGAEEARVPEGEDPAVRGHQPVALARRRGRHPHDRLRQDHRTGRAEEPGVTEGEDAAVRGHQPVALARRGGGHRDHRPVEPLPSHRPVERRPAEGEDAAVGGGQPRAPVGRGRRRRPAGHRQGGAGGTGGDRGGQEGRDGRYGTEPEEEGSPGTAHGGTRNTTGGFGSSEVEASRSEPFAPLRCCTQLIRRSGLSWAQVRPESILAAAAAWAGRTSDPDERGRENPAGTSGHGSGVRRPLYPRPGSGKPEIPEMYGRRAA